MHTMVGVWFVFTLMLFVAEPLFLHRRLLGRAKVEPQATFKRVERLHRVPLAISFITLLGAVLGKHGLLVIG
jgi:protein gp37